jgi:hypothetical protein
MAEMAAVIAGQAVSAKKGVRSKDSEQEFVGQTPWMPA